MDLKSFQQLLTPAGQAALQEAVALSPRESEFLTHFQSLSRRFLPDVARAALETAILRREASSKFPYADKLYLTRQAFEQASSDEISSYRAERYRPFPRLADLGCSIGSDTISLAKLAPAVGIDVDPLRLAMASANLNTLEFSDHTLLIQSDLTLPLPFKPGSTALFFDPARRSDHRRMFSVEQYHPALSTIKNWLQDYTALGVKISPGVDLDQLVDYDAELEFISLRGELKEAVLWFGSLRSASRTATLLPGPHQLVAEQERGRSASSTPIAEPKKVLYEPDPAVIRAGLVGMLAEMLDASQLDPEIAYLTSATTSHTPFARAWNIIDWFPFQLKRLRTYLRQHDIGHVTVKKRGSPLEPAFLIHQLRLKGSLECTLVLTHLRGMPIVIICNRL